MQVIRLHKNSAHAHGTRSGYSRAVGGGGGGIGDERSSQCGSGRGAMPLFENMCATSWTSGDDCSGAVERRAGDRAARMRRKAALAALPSGRRRRSMRETGLSESLGESSGAVIPGCSMMTMVPGCCDTFS